MSKQIEEQLIPRIRDELGEEPTLSDPSKIFLDVERTGGLFNKRTIVTMQGRVRNALEAKKAAQIVETKLGNAAQLENRLTVENA